MRGPKITCREIIVVLQTAVERLEDLGIPQPYAICAVARDKGVAVDRVAALVGEPRDARRDRGAAASAGQNRRV